MKATVAGVLGLLAVAICTLPSIQAMQRRNPTPPGQSVLEQVQGTAERVRLGELSMSTEYPGWITYRYKNSVKGFEISFPPDWSIGERPVSESSDEVATVDIFRRPVGFNRIILNLADTDAPFSFGPRYYLEKVANATSTSFSIQGEAGLLFDNTAISYVDGGIPVMGRLIFIPGRSVVIRVAEKSSYEPDNQNRELIDDEITQKVFDTFRFERSVF